MEVKFIKFLDNIYVGIDGEIRGRMYRRFDGHYYLNITDSSYPISQDNLETIAKYIEKLEKLHNGA